MSTKHRMCLVGMLVLFSSILAIGVRDDSAQSSIRIFPEPIYSDTGVPLESLFVGVSPSQHADYLLDPAEKLTRNVCQDDGTIPVISAIAKWVEIETAFASGCEQSEECSDHYMVPDYRDCQYSCGDIEEFHYSEPIYDWNYTDGWQYSGDESCCTASCAEEGCQNEN